ncbi:nucleotidyltransferase domain-containing protein [Longispora albida]|uniref:nucleotidyltransferase domain-containing protein n=1 Tax=Longispora albida TaxID=203523 RepID=UPI00037820A2|nr:nucleotidyltransferase domain-containing protein [Longispora albida]
MTGHSSWRRRIAETFALRYTGLPQVVAVLLAGSVARGLADRWSDIELMVFWASAPDDALRRELAGPGAEVHDYDEDNAEWSEDVLVNGVELQTSHRTATQAESWMDAAVTGHDPDLVKQDMIALIRYGVPLSGADLVASWCARTDVYPAALSLAMIREHLGFRTAWHRRKLADRGELVPLHRDLTETAERLWLVLCGLNRVWFPHLGYKWLPTGLPLAPDRYADRLSELLSAPPHMAAGLADDLIAETLHLVDTHFPEAGAAEELRYLHSTRPVWDAPPPDLP